MSQCPGSNRRPMLYESIALPTELHWHALEPLIGIEPMTSSFVYTSPCGRTRLYLSPKWRPLSVVRALGATVLSAVRILTVIRDSYSHYCDMGRGLRPTNDVLYQLSYNGVPGLVIKTITTAIDVRIDYLSEIFNQITNLFL